MYNKLVELLEIYIKEKRRIKTPETEIITTLTFIVSQAIKEAAEKK